MDGVNWISKPTPVGSIINAAYNFGNGNLLAAGGGAPNLFKISDQSNDYASRFFYDALGRLVISQNSKQFNKSTKAYSYTIYDDLGRITEVGEITGNSPDPNIMAGNINGVISSAAYIAWLATGTKNDVTRTVYDLSVTTPCGFVQENLRKRVSAIYLDTDGNVGNGYSYGTFYSYDIHGNVKSLLQENTGMPVGQTCKQMDYSYDLISGKVNKLSYQKGQPDAWHHKYEYDAENRITNVYTSKDNLDWTRDAKYFYYLHGPLARVELSQDKVQGIDYAYTLQGWLKGINSISLAGTNDIGKDGQAGNGYHPTITDLHKYIGEDAAAYALHYYGYNSGGNFISDYKAIEPGKNTNVLRFDGDVSTHPYFSPGNSLYNGNIMAMASTIYTSQPGSGPRNPQLATYKYDQLNRINLMQTTTQIAGNVWSAALPANINNYRNEFSYDPNGNILSQKRYDNSGVTTDNMTYQYLNSSSGRKLANRLYHVNDAIGAAVNTGDIDDQGSFNPSAATINAANNYGYDETGNLVRDNQEGIASIDWTVYGKIKSITRTGPSTAKNLIFTYDGSGNRVSKTSYTNGQAQSLWQTTYYVRDAQGNIMATYDYKPAGGSGPLTLNLIEHPVYGSSRIGQRTYYDTDNLGATSPYKTSTSTYTMALQGGNLVYELSNHLGNVLTAVSDRKIPVPNGSNPNLVDGYRAEIVSSVDYYPFGAPMPRRQLNNGSYRYGFNGKENDNEVKGAGNQQDYGMRIYDPRIGRFLSTDPLTRSFPMLTPYQFANNRPIDGIDVDGLERLDYRLTYHDNKPQLDLQSIDVNRSISLPPVISVDYNGEQYLFSNVKQLKQFVSNPSSVQSERAQWEAKGWGDVHGVELAMYDMAFAAPFMASWAKSAGKLEGGAYSALETGGKDRHHLISGSEIEKAELGVTREEATAIRMEVTDHALTGSFGNTRAARAFRKAEGELMKQGKFMEAFELGVNDVYRVLKDQGKDIKKYEGAINEARKHFTTEILPKLEESYKKANP